MLLRQRTTLALGALVALHGTLSAQPAPRATAALAKHVDAYVAPLIELRVFAGTIMVSRDDRVVLERNYGLASIEHGIPITSATRFRIASISKSFTKALIGRLVDQKLLSLDDTLSRWLPTVPSANRITLRQLLTHRAGVPNMNSLPYDEEAFDPNSLATLVESIARAKPDFEPGSRFRYSNGGYALLARVVELVTHAPFDEVLTREILLPLHLDQTRHEADGMIVAHLASGYMPSPSVPNVMVRAPFQEMMTKTGGGSMVSSARDLTTWVRAIGRSDILTAETWTALFPIEDRALTFDGRAPGFNVIVQHDRKRDLTTVVLANNYSAGMVADVAQGVEAMALGLTPKPLPVVRPAAIVINDARALVGKYSVPDGTLPVPPGTMVDVRLAGDQPVAYLGATPLDVLIPQAPRLCLARALWSTFEPMGSTGTVDSIRIRALYRDFTFVVKRAPER